MPQRPAIRDLVDRFVTALNGQDIDAVVALFTDDAEQDDPMGAGTNRGHAQIRDFFGQAFSVPLSATLDGPATIHADVAAFRVRIEIPAGRTPFRLLVTYVAEISPGADGDLRIARIRAVPDSVVLN